MPPNMKIATLLSFTCTVLLLGSGFLAGYLMPAYREKLLGIGTLSLFFITMPLFLIWRYGPKLKELDKPEDEP